MTKQNQLLKLLDNVFGFEHIRNSSFKKVKQEFNQKRNEHVITIEYRVETEGKQSQKINQDSKRKQTDFKSGSLLRSINDEVNRKSKVDKLDQNTP